MQLKRKFLNYLMLISSTQFPIVPNFQRSMTSIFSDFIEEIMEVDISLFSLISSMFQVYDYESLCYFSSLFSVFSGILCNGTTMEIRRHFGAKAKERKLRTILVQESARSVDRHTLGVDRHQFRPRKNPRCLRVYKRSSMPQKISLLALLVP